MRNCDCCGGKPRIVWYEFGGLKCLRIECSSCYKTTNPYLDNIDSLRKAEEDWDNGVIYQDNCVSISAIANWLAKYYMPSSWSETYEEKVKCWQEDIEKAILFGDLKMNE